MDENMWERWGAAAGVVFVVLLMLSVFIAGMPPHIDASNEKIANFVGDHRRAIETSAVFGMFAAMFFVWFASHLRHVMQRAEGGSEALSPIVFGSAVFIAAIGAMSALPLVVLAYSSHNPDVMGDAGLVRMLWNANGMLTAMVGVGTVLFLVSMSVAMLRGELLAPWLGWAGLAVALVSAVGGIAGFYVTKYNGFWAFLGFVGLLGFAAVVLVASALMVRQPEVSRGVAPKPVFGH